MELTIERFRSAHESSYEKALSEIRAGRKESHWIWYIFPQIQGLGHSTRAMYYAIENREEAVEYWNDPILRSHMREICEELLKHEKPIEQIMGYPDNLKLCSSMTLFWMVTGEPIFQAVLNQFYHGTMDRFTVERLT
jgi:uncharacterized protein (DUF1810 family)